MYYLFQNLKKDSNKLFHFRGSIGRYCNKNWIKYEISSGPSFKIKYQHGDVGDSDDASTIIFGLGLITFYITFYLPKSWYFKRKCVATWDNNREFYLTEGREYGFYLYDWAFVWSWHSKPHESSSKDPWWMSQYIHLDELFLGKSERLENQVLEVSDIWFKIGNKEFKMDSIKWEKNQAFRRFIPFSLYHKTYYSVQMDITSPPMRAGKGENSWDCGDDGTFGMSSNWKFNIPNWANKEESTKHAIKYYVEHVMKDAARYGGSSSENGIRKGLTWEYIGRRV